MVSPLGGSGRGGLPGSREGRGDGVEGGGGAELWAEVQ